MSQLFSLVLHNKRISVTFSPSLMKNKRNDKRSLRRMKFCDIRKRYPKWSIFRSIARSNGKNGREYCGNTQKEPIYNPAGYLFCNFHISSIPSVAAAFEIQKCLVIFEVYRIEHIVSYVKPMDGEYFRHCTVASERFHF